MASTYAVPRVWQSRQEDSEHSVAHALASFFYVRGCGYYILGLEHAHAGTDAYVPSRLEVPHVPAAPSVLQVVCVTRLLRARSLALPLLEVVNALLDFSSPSLVALCLRRELVPRPLYAGLCWVGACWPLAVDSFFLVSVWVHLSHLNSRATWLCCPLQPSPLG